MKMPELFRSKTYLDKIPQGYYTMRSPTKIKAAYEGQQRAADVEKFIANFRYVVSKEEFESGGTVEWCNDFMRGQQDSIDGIPHESGKGDVYDRGYAHEYEVAAVAAEFREAGERKWNQ